MIKIKPVKQSKSCYCGPASLKMVLDYYGSNKSQETIAKLTGTTSKTGCSKEAIIRAAKKLGFDVKSNDNTALNDLKKYINKGIPVIVDWFSDKFEGHYSVVVGMDKNNIFIADPQYGKVRKMKHAEFMDRWFDFLGPPSKKGLVVRRMIAVDKIK